MDNPNTKTKKTMEAQAKKELGAVNYVFTCMDQPRGWKGAVGKALFNGTVTATLTIVGMELYRGYKTRHRVANGPRVVPMPNRQAPQ